MSENELTSGALNGVRGQIYYRMSAPQPATTARGIVVIAHGLGEHSGRYEQLMSELNAVGFYVYAPDHQGHGRSAGPRAQLVIAEAVADLDQLVSIAAQAQPGLPIVLFGHSLGGAIALRYALAHQDRLKCLALSSPAAAIDAGPLAAISAKLIGRIAPGLPTRKISSATLSHDPTVVAAYDADPLNFHGAVPAGTAREMLRSAATLPDDAAKITLPTLLMYGTDDQLCPPRGAIMLSDRLGTPDLEVRAFEGFFHELLNETDRQQVLSVLLSWLDRQTPGDGRARPTAPPV